MKKILLTLSIALCTSLFSQAQIATLNYKTAKNPANYYIGSILSGNSYTHDYTTEFLGNVIYKPNLTTGSFGAEAAMGTEPGLKALQDYIATFRDKISDKNSNFSFSSLSPISQEEGQLDKLLSTKDAAKKLFNEPDLLTKYDVYYSTATMVWFSVESDFPEDGEFVSKAEFEKISSKDPIAIISVAYGRKATLIIASNQEEEQVKKAFKIFQNQDKSQYELANSILQDAFIGIVTVGNSPIDTLELSAQQIIEKYINYMSRPIEDKELLSPISFEAVSLKNPSTIY